MPKDKTKKVKKWWDDNPFTFIDGEGVGIVANDQQDLEFFKKVERTFRRHGQSYQEKNEPLYSNFVDYESLKGKKVLDIASGTGVLTIEFARMGCDTTAIDITPRAVASTKRNLSLRKLDGEVLEMDAQKMDFEDNKFDFVNAHGCLMHMPNMDNAITEIYRVLDEDGSACAWMYHKGWYFWFGILFLRGILKGMLLKYKFNITKLTSRYSDGLHTGGNPHTLFQTKNEAINRFKKSGFKEVHAKVIFNPVEFYSFPSKKFSFGQYLPYRVQKFLGRFFGLGIIVFAKK